VAGRRRQRLVLVHGSVIVGETVFAEQRSLADTFDLVVPTRPGYFGGPPARRFDLDAQGSWLREQLAPGDHVCGLSYGAIVAAHAAAGTDSLRSLTLIEPPALCLARHDSDARKLAGQFEKHWREGSQDPLEFLLEFLELLFGERPPAHDPFWRQPMVLQGAVMLRREPGPWEAGLPLDTLRIQPYPKLVVSGAWRRAFDAVADAAARELDGQRLVLAGAGHNVNQAPGFNARWRAFLSAANGIEVCHPCSPSGGLPDAEAI
jgi:pimeloyl-ACP methyl ester carboxylesterase